MPIIFWPLAGAAVGVLGWEYFDSDETTNIDTQNNYGTLTAVAVAAGVSVATIYMLKKL